MNDQDIMREIRGSDEEKLLMALAAADGPFSPSSAAKALGTDERTALIADQRLEDLGLVSPDKRVAHVIALTSRGRALAGSISRSRKAGPDRWDAVQRAIVRSVLSDTDDAVVSVDGVAVTEEERRLAVTKLEDWRLVKVLRGWGGTALRLLPQDRIYEVAGIDGLLADHYEREAAYTDNRITTTFGDGSTVGGVQAGGTGNVQKVTQTVGATERAQILFLVGSALAEVGPDGPAELREALNAIKEAAAPDKPQRDSLRDKIAQGVVVAGAVDASQTVLQTLAAMLGLV
ncbi:hypothetical protein BCF74_1377 [Knoellia remsis]|uniref:Uncharacterized protein n=1 Tax=Knoellia remsis TaxID=407159 RepID=A0A2T0TZ30_9MICO|nr:hypothetical protein [Knoellia remsis]PRY50926.1 hypothetical protein BCF74_1377 [Knoellia remsis]